MTLKGQQTPPPPAAWCSPPRTCSCVAAAWRHAAAAAISSSSSTALQRRRRPTLVPAAAAASAASGDSDGAPASASASGSGSAAPAPLHVVGGAATDGPTYSLEETRALVETAMLAAVSGLAFLLSTLLKLDTSLGYFLPLPVVIAACRSGPAAGWGTMTATAFLLLVLLGPLRAVTYVLMHGMTAAALGSMWVWKWPWLASVAVGSASRMAGQMGYLVLSSATMNENLFAVMVANVHNLMVRDEMDEMRWVGLKGGGIEGGC